MRGTRRLRRLDLPAGRGVPLRHLWSGSSDRSCENASSNCARCSIDADPADALGCLLRQWCNELSAMFSHCRAAKGQVACLRQMFLVEAIVLGWRPLSVC